MPTYETRTQRALNESALMRQDEAGQRALRHVARMGFAMGLLVAIRYYHGSDNVVIFAAALFVAFWGWGILGLYIDLTTWLKPVEIDELYTMTGAHIESNHQPARLLVQTGPNRIEATDLGFADTDEKIRLGVVLQGNGWRWRRDPYFGLAKVSGIAGRGYTSAYTVINRQARKAGVIDEDGYVRPEFRAWFTSPTPDVVTDIRPERPDDDPS